MMGTECFGVRQPSGAPDKAAEGRRSPRLLTRDLKPEASNLEPVAFAKLFLIKCGDRRIGPLIGKMGIPN